MNEARRYYTDSDVANILGVKLSTLVEYICRDKDGKKFGFFYQINPLNNKRAWSKEKIDQAFNQN